MVMMKCVRCGYKWNYRGTLRTKSGRTRLPFKVSCPQCKYPQYPRKAIENYKKKKGGEKWEKREKGIIAVIEGGKKKDE